MAEMAPKQIFGLPVSSCRTMGVFILTCYLNMFDTGRPRGVDGLCLVL